MDDDVTMDAGESSVADAGLEPQQSEHEQHQRGIRSSMATLSLLDKLGMNNTNAERGIRSSDGVHYMTDFNVRDSLFMNNINLELGLCLAGENIREKSTNNNPAKKCKGCKSSRCLLLHCECFAADLYCADSCSCQDCLNEPDYEDIVNDFREQVERCNPQAFAPKVVEQGTDAPANVELNLAMPSSSELTLATPSSSATQNIGCNCSRCKCANNYCKCFKAEVGCDQGCGCEYCENPF